MLLNVAILVLLFVLLVCVPIILWIHSPANRVASADEYYFDGNIRKAEKVLLKVWTRRNDVPAHLVEIYFQEVKKGNLEYAKKAFLVSTEELDEDAIHNLSEVQNKIKAYIEQKASDAFHAKDYDTALKYNQLLVSQGEKYKHIDKSYRTQFSLSQIL